MQKFKNTLKFLIFIFIFVFLIQIVFSANYPMSGLEKAEEGHSGFVYCDYNSETNVCNLSGGTYKLVNNTISVPSLSGSINLKITGVVNIITDTNNLEFEINSYNIYSIIVDKNLTLDTNLLSYNFNTNIIINNGAVFKINNISDHFRQILVDVANDDGDASLDNQDEDEDEEEQIEENYDYDERHSTDFYLPKLNFLNIVVNKGSFKLIQENYIAAGSYDYNSVSDNSDLSILIDTDFDKNINDVNLTVYPQNVYFENIDNNGSIEIKVNTLSSDNTFEDIVLEHVISKIYFNNFKKNLPKDILINDYYSNNENFGQIFLTTCENNIVIPFNKNYKNICALIYTHPEESKDLNTSNTGISKIINLINNCNYESISDQLSSYLLADTNQTVTPFIFGNITKINNDRPINPKFTTYGLFDMSDNSNKSSIVNKGNNLFIFHLLPDKNKTLELIKSYQFKFKLDANSDLEYSDINLNYPFKIYK